MEPELTNALLIDKNFHPAVCSLWSPMRSRIFQVYNYPGGNEFSKGNNVPYVYWSVFILILNCPLQDYALSTLPLNLVNEEKFLGQILTQDISRC